MNKQEFEQLKKMFEVVVEDKLSAHDKINHEEHEEHHEFIEILIAEYKEKKERREKIKTTLLGWFFITVLSGIGYTVGQGILHIFQALTK